MYAKWNRIIPAGLISLLVYGGTSYWYWSQQKDSGSRSEKMPIAFISQTENDVQRRPASRQIWQMIAKGDPVYPGEAVRTSSDATARIHLADGGRSIELDPDTLVVIHQSPEEIALDLVDGRLLVEQEKDSATLPALTLKSGEAKMDLSKASAKLSKTSNKNLDVQILKGTAKVRKGGQTHEIGSGVHGVVGVSGSKLFEVSLLQALTPADSSVYYLGADASEPVLFSWSGAPPDSEVRIYSGKTSRDLRALGPWVPAAKGTLSINVPAGRHFWKIVAREKDAAETFAESPIQRFKVVKLAPAKDLKPGPNALMKLKMTKKEENVLFSWRKADEASFQKLEIATSADFSRMFKVERIEHESFETTLSLGTYYWRVSTFYEGKETPVLSAVHKLVIEPLYTKVEMAWTGASAGDRIYYIGTPIIGFTWDVDHPEIVKSYKFRLAETTEALREPASSPRLKIVETTLRQVNTEVARPGLYLATVEAYGEDGKPLGQLEVHPITIEPKPLLAPPKFIPEEGTLRADQSGKIDLKWNPMTGAKEYWLTLKDPSGQELRRTRFLGTNATLINLLPGEYRVAIYAIDEHGRKSRELPARKISVPSSSGLDAPKLRKVRVK